jgi:hypothetical protein
MSRLFGSLILSTLLAFASPILLVGTLLVACLGASFLPGIAWLGEGATAGVVEFLRIFGGGYPLQGMFAIGLTCGMVGGAFDFFNFYLYQPGSKIGKPNNGNLLSNE